MAVQTLQIEIGAALSGSFGATMSGSTNQLTKLGSTIKQLENQSKSVTQIQSMKQATLSAKQTWHDAELQVKSLAMEMKAVTNPSKQMVTEFERSKTAAAKAKQAYLQNRDALQKMGMKLKQSGIDTKSLASEQTKLETSLDKLKNKYRTLDKIMQERRGIQARRANLRGQIMDTVAVAAAIAAPIKAAVNFESAMADVRKVVDFEKPEGLTDLGNTIKQMSRDIPISAEGLAQITAAGGQLGVKEKDLAAFTETVAKMSTAFDMTAEEAGTSMAQLSNVFSIPITDMKNLGDAINHISNNMAAKAKDIVPALTRAGGSVRQFGLEADQAAALVATLISMGQMPEKAGTAISAMLVKLQTADKQGKKFQDALKGIGLSAEGLKEKIGKDAQGAILMFLEAVKKVDKQKRAGLLVDIFGKNYQKDAALIVESLDTYKNSVGLIADKSKYAGSMQTEFANRSATTANNMQLLKNSVVETGINIGVTLLPSLNSIVGAIRYVTSGFADFAKDFPIITRVIMGITTLLVGAKVAALAFGYAGTFLQDGFKVLKSGWTKLSAVFAAHPILAPIMAIAIGAFFVIKNWDKVKAFFSTIWEKIQPIWEKFASFVQGFWDTISAPFKAIGKAWNWITGGQEGARAINEKADESRASAKSKESVKIIKEAASAPLRGAALVTSNKTQHNNYTITVNTQNSNNPKSVAEEVKKMLESKDDAYLYDSVAGAY